MIRRRIWIFFLPLLLSLPFLGRAYFVDDNYFVEIASWLKEHPLQPYDFRADDAGPQNRGWEKDGFVRMVNPLAHHYYVALLMCVWPGSTVPEWFLRWGCVLLSCGTALLLFELARRWTFHPMLAVTIAVLTPAFWLSSYSLLIDPTMVFFSILGLWFLVRSVELDSVLYSVIAGLAWGIAVLAKYPALFVLPLGVVWVALNAPDVRRGCRLWPAFLIPLLFLLAYSVYTAQLYGRPHLLAASARMVQMAAWPKLLSLLVFFSGSLLVPLLAWVLFSGRLRIIAALIGIALFALLVGSVGGFAPSQALLMALWLSTSVLFIAGLVAGSVRSIVPFLNSRSYPALWYSIRDRRVDVFLGAWILGFLVMMVLVMNWVAARYYCLVVPAVVFLMVRMLERFRPATSRTWLAGVSAGLFVMGASLAYADFQQAQPTREIGVRLLNDGYGGGERHFYLGDSFTMSYMKQHGWQPAFQSTEFRAGDLVLSKEVTMPLIWFFRKNLRGRLLETYRYPTRWPIKVMDYQGSAGFYASVWGALPFSFSTGPWEQFRLFEILD